MPRLVERLSQKKIDRLVKEARPGRHNDGDGLYLQIPEASWISRFRFQQNRREMGLGPLRRVSLEAARKENARIRGLLADGIDPIEERHAARATAKLEAAKAMTFKECAERYVKAHRAGWSNDKHAAQWSATLATYADPVIGPVPMQSVDTGLVLKVLEPTWATKTETAGRLRGRIENILDYAKARGWREGENPARWRGHLDQLLPKPSKVRKVEHHAALPYAELPDFMAELRRQNGVAARALEFAILTAARTGEAIGARWDEIDLAARLWVVPAERMKAGKKHRVPLSARAITILEEMKQLDETYVFPGNKPASPLSNMAFLMLLRRMKRSDLTAHGFRSTFRDWAAERTNFPSEVAEMALAHMVSSKVEAAYRRGTMFERRRRIMTAWSDYSLISKAGDKVVPLHAKSA